MPHILLIKTGCSFDECITAEGDFDQLFLNALADSPAQVTVVDAQQQCLPPLSDFQGVLITGSHSMVTDQAPWSEALLPAIRRMAALNLPVLGVCYGHQLIAQALGGEAGDHPEGPEIGTYPIELTAAGQCDPLLGSLPSRFMAHLTHSQSALKLPDNAVLLASNAYEPHQAFRVNDTIWGVQFHPEFSATINRIYFDKQQDKLAQRGQDCLTLRQQIVDTPEANQLIRRFVALIEQTPA